MFVRKQGANMPRKSNKPKVLEIDGDGLFATIEFTQENGERVRAIYRISSWINPPQEMLDRTKIILSRGYLTVMGPRLTNR
jgi:hypothetical protein